MHPSLVVGFMQTDILSSQLPVEFPGLSLKFMVMPQALFVPVSVLQHIFICLQRFIFDRLFLVENQAWEYGSTPL
ncbi:hypothetical protein PGT21_019748 [Puccinia graminis f. sp. tritici]|uniref:Uncharacterized protein n=1 Tax=Puccinia graminis f. sp. tritici TaxID=56615 RepID=A0A5B0QB51_PUCGR|nr:hypothetical protein PGT21_019748 [Puccinia graminis f. sp. tritici]